MSRPKRELADYVPSRWKLWLTSMFECIARARGHDATPSVIKGLGNEFAPYIAARGDRDSAPRSDIQAWLRGDKYIQPRRVFLVGQALGAFTGVPPYCSGIVALHGSGHFPEAIACILALMREAEADSGYKWLASGDIFTPSPEQKTLAQSKLAYAFGCVGVLWTSHADLDGIQSERITGDERSAARDLVPPAPLEACEAAWYGTQPSSNVNGKVVYRNVPDIGLASWRGVRYPNALIGWAALAEETWLCAVRNPSARVAWDRVRPILIKYMEVAHEQMASGRTERSAQSR